MKATRSFFEAFAEFERPIEVPILRDMTGRTALDYSLGVQAQNEQLIFK